MPRSKPGRHAAHKVRVNERRGYRDRDAGGTVPKHPTEAVLARKSAKSERTPPCGCGIIIDGLRGRLDAVYALANELLGNLAERVYDRNQHSTASMMECIEAEAAAAQAALQRAANGTGETS